MRKTATNGFALHSPISSGLFFAVDFVVTVSVVSCGVLCAECEDDGLDRAAPARAGSLRRHFSRSHRSLCVQIDHARLIKLPERAATVVVGNPLIADITIQPGGVGLINARGYGTTNLIVLDRTGAVLTEKQVTVKGPYANTVVVYRGMNRNTYSCAPFCEPRITLGDSPGFFGENLGQTGTWLGQVQGAAQIGATSENPRDRSDRDRDRDNRTFNRRDSGSSSGFGWPFF
jgi:hypothetical protein